VPTAGDIPPLEGGIVAAAFSGDGRFAAIGGARGAAVLEIPSRRQVAFVAAARVQGHALALSADGRRLGAVCLSREVGVWDVRTGALVAAVPVVPGPEAIAFSPRGDLVAVGGAHLTIEVWDLAGRRSLWRKAATSADGRVRSLAFFPDGRFLLSGNSLELSAGSGDEVDVWPESPRIWEVASAAQIAALDHGQSLIAISADGRRVAGTAGSTVHVWDRQSGREIAGLQHFPVRISGRWVIGVGLDPDGRRAISLGSDGTLVAWDVATERALWRVAAHPGDAEAFALSPDGRHAVTVGRDGRGRLWMLETPGAINAHP
jgi:WD40 repeat protein